MSKVEKTMQSSIPCNPQTIQLHFLLMINMEWYESWLSGKEKDKSEKQGQKIRGPGADDRYISTKKKKLVFKYVNYYQLLDSLF